LVYPPAHVGYSLCRTFPNIFSEEYTSVPQTGAQCPLPGIFLAVVVYKEWRRATRESGI
jgi:hypothetical protein